MAKIKKRAPNGSVPRYFDPGYKTSYQKLKDDFAAQSAALAEAVKALESMQEFHDCMEAQRKDEPVPEGHEDETSGCSDGVCYVVGDIIERGMAVAARLRSPSLAVAEDFFCCKDQENPCHPIRDYCSTGRGRMERAKNDAAREAEAERRVVEAGQLKPCGDERCIHPCCPECGVHDVYQRGHANGCKRLAALDAARREEGV